MNTGEKVRWCEVGGHEVHDRKEWLSECGCCGRRFCDRHKGRMKARPGDLVSCPACVEMVKQINDGRHMQFLVNAAKKRGFK